MDKKKISIAGSEPKYISGRKTTWRTTDRRIIANN